MTKRALVRLVKSLLFLVPATAAFTYFCGYVLYLAFSGPYIQIPELIGGILLSLIDVGLFAGIYMLFTETDIFFEHDRLIERSLFGKEKRATWLTDITSWEETIVEGSKFRQLKMYYRDGVWTLNWGLGFYEELIIQLQQKGISGATNVIRPEAPDTPRPSNAQIAVAAIPLLLLGAFIIWGGARAYTNPKNGVDKIQLVKIAGTLSGEPEINDEDSDNEYVELLLKEYPTTPFLINGLNFTAADVFGIDADLHKGDSVFMKVKAEDYRKKITRELPRNFYDKYIGYSDNIDIYGLRNSERKYLTMNSIERANEDDSKWALVFILLGAGFMVWSVADAYKKATKPPNG